MSLQRAKRLLVMVTVLIASTLVAVPGASATDDAQQLGRKVRLNADQKGWYSAGMHNDQAACGPFVSSEDAVVWHLFADLPENAQDVAVKKAVVRFRGKHEVAVEVAKSGTRVDVWARVSVADPTDPELARKGAHTSIRRANVRLKKKVVPQDGSVNLQLGNVCYDGLGPVGEINIVMQALTCDGYDRIRGNEINDDSAQWDATAGGYEDWRKIYDGNAPKVRLRQKARRGCSFDENQQFAVGTSASMDNYAVLPGMTTGEDGTLHISSRDLPEVHQRALFWVHDHLWFQWVDNQEFGAIQCYRDRMHADDVEWIDFKNINRLPANIYCVAWNVAVDDPADIATGTAESAADVSV